MTAPLPYDRLPIRDLLVYTRSSESGSLALFDRAEVAHEAIVRTIARIRPGISAADVQMDEVDWHRLGELALNHAAGDEERHDFAWFAAAVSDYGATNETLFTDDRLVSFLSDLDTHNVMFSRHRRRPFTFDEAVRLAERLVHFGDIREADGKRFIFAVEDYVAPFGYWRRRRAFTRSQALEISNELVGSRQAPGWLRSRGAGFRGVMAEMSSAFPFGASPDPFGFRVSDRSEMVLRDVSQFLTYASAQRTGAKTWANSQRSTLLASAEALFPDASRGQLLGLPLGPDMQIALVRAARATQRRSNEVVLAISGACKTSPGRLESVLGSDDPLGVVWPLDPTIQNLRRLVNSGRGRFARASQDTMFRFHTALNKALDALPALLSDANADEFTAVPLAARTALLVALKSDQVDDRYDVRLGDVFTDYDYQRSLQAASAEETRPTPNGTIPFRESASRYRAADPIERLSHAWRDAGFTEPIPPRLVAAINETPGVRDLGSYAALPFSALSACGLSPQSLGRVETVDRVLGVSRHISPPGDGPTIPAMFSAHRQGSTFELAPGRQKPAAPGARIDQTPPPTPEATSVQQRRQRRLAREGGQKGDRGGQSRRSPGGPNRLT